MQAALIQLVSILEADNTLQGYLQGSAGDKKIYPALPDQEEQYPCIVYYEIGSSFRNVPKTAEDTTIQFSIFTRESTGNKALIENIASRLNELLNYYKQVSAYPRVVYSILENKFDKNEEDRRIFSKILIYKLYIKN